MKVTLLNVRLAFPKLWEAKAVGDGDSKYYSAAFPIVPGSENAKALDDAITKVSKEKWAEKGAAILATIIDKNDIGYTKKPLRSSEGEIYSGFEDCFSVNASLREDLGRPLVLDRTKNPLTQKDGKPYAGCYVNAVVDVWAQDNSNGKRINVQLKGIQFVKDGDAFGTGGAATPDEFDDLGEGSDEPDLC